MDREAFERHKRKEHSTASKYIRQFIFGTEDGLIGGLGLITGVSVATLSSALVILSGIALMLTQAVSMGAGVYLSVKSQREVYDRFVEREKQAIRRNPALEREEVREVYRNHGFQGRDLDYMVKKITANKKTWLNVVTESYGLDKKGLERPGIATLIMALSVMVGAFIPVIPYFFMASQPAITASIIATVIALFIFGAGKTLFTNRNWVKSGIEMVAVGIGAAAAGYAIGNVFLFIS